MRVRVLGIVALLTLAAALGYAVTVGATHRVDAHAVQDLMPWRACPYHPQSSVDQLIAPLPAALCHSEPPFYEPPAAGRFAFALASTAAPAMAVVLIAALAGLAPRTRRGRTLVVGLGSVVVATLAEITGKLLVTRPPILRVIHTHHVAVSTTHSFPCGHTIRACIVLYLVAAMRPRWTPVALAWFTAVQVALVATSGHTLTDIGGGILVGAAIAAAAAWALGRTPAPALVGAAPAAAAAGDPLR